MRLILILAITFLGILSAFHSPFYALLFYTWNAYFRPEDWAGWIQIIVQMKLSYTAALLVFAMTLFRLDQVGGPFPANVHVGFMGLFVLHSGISMATSDYSEYSWPLWVEFLKQVSITYMMVTLVNDVQRLRMFLIVVAYSLGIENAKQGWIGLLLHPGASNHNESPFLGDNNGVAVGMLMLVPVFGALARTSGSWWERHLHQFMLIGCLYRAVSTYSRGGFVSCLALGIVYWLRSRNKIASFVAISLVAAVIVPVLPPDFWDRMGTMRSVRQEHIADPTQQPGEEAEAGERGPDASMMGRIHFWKTAVAMANDHPMLGIGFNAYNFAYNSYDASKGFFGRSRSVHSMWFGLLGELGYLGFFLYCVLTAMAAWRCQAASRIARKLDEGEQFSVLALAIQTSLVPMLVGGTFLPNQYNEMYWHFLGLTIATLLIARRMEREQMERGQEEAAAAEEDEQPTPGPWSTPQRA